MTEQRYLLGLAYQAGPDPRISKGADGGRDYFTPAELEKAAWQFMKSARTVGLFHEDGTEGQAEVTESYIYRGPEWPQADGSVIKSGDWLIGCVLNEKAWDLYKSGVITGFSPQGSAKRLRSTP
jgi:hypothetical protein